MKGKAGKSFVDSVTSMIIDNLYSKTDQFILSSAVLSMTVVYFAKDICFVRAFRKLVQICRELIGRSRPKKSQNVREPETLASFSSVSSLRLQPRDLGDLLRMHADGQGPIKQTRFWPYSDELTSIQCLDNWPPVFVPVPPLDFGRKALETKEMRELESHISWKNLEYQAFPAFVVIMKDVVIHGAVGLVAVGSDVIAETLWHTNAEPDNYHRDNDFIVINHSNCIRMTGKTISLLGSAHNYFHSLIDGVARLALIPSDLLLQADRILLPETGVGQREIIGLYGLPSNIEVRYVSRHETFFVEELIFTFSIHGVFLFHPVANEFFDRVLAGMPVAGAPGPEHIYIDRRHSGLRRLVNEDAVVAALEALGFVSVRLEALSQEEQIAVFRDARVIVAPHGAGLTNLGFATRGTTVIELVMDAYLNWCYRHIAAIRGLHYDCVVGQAFKPWADLNPAFHAQQWQIDESEVLDAVRATLERRN